MTPEGLHDNLLLPIVLSTAFTEFGLVKGHGLSESNDKSIAGRAVESFIGAGTRLKKLMQRKREGGAININHAGEHPVLINTSAEM